MTVADQQTYDEAMWQERPRHRGRKVLITLLVFLVVLAALLVVADRAAVGVAERAVTERINQELAQRDAQASRPEVSVDGFPFLTQVLAGRYESISILLRDVRGSVNGNSVTLPRLDVDVQDVRAPLDTLRSGTGEVTAGHVDGEAILTYDTVAQLVERPGLKLTEENGKLVGEAPLDLPDRKFTVRGVADLSVDAQGRIQVRFTQLTVEGTPGIPDASALLDSYAKRISFTVPLPELPFQLVVHEVRVLPQGLAVSASAEDVPLNAVP